jgi:hypothetical protein
VVSNSVVNTDAFYFFLLISESNTALLFIPRWKGVLSRILPILGNVRDMHRPTFANGVVISLSLSRWMCNMRYYLRLCADLSRTG